MSKNKKVMSIAILPEMHEDLKRVAKRKGVSSSTYVGDLVEKALKVNPDEDVVVIGKPIEDDIQPIILKIPVSITSNHEKLKDWLDLQLKGILQAMTGQD